MEGEYVENVDREASYMPFTEIATEMVVTARDRYLLFLETVGGADEMAGAVAENSLSGDEGEEDGKLGEGKREELPDAPRAQTPPQKTFSLDLDDDGEPVNTMERPVIYCKHPFFWSVEEVETWVEYKGFTFSIDDLFTQKKIDGSTLLELDVQKLGELGIKFDQVTKRIATV